MPDNILRPVIEEKQVNGQNNVQEGTLTKLQREADLLRGGIADGVRHRLSDPGEILRDSGIAFAGAYALKTALNAGGRWGAAAKVVGGVCGLAAAADVGRRAVPTLGAMADTWKSGNNFDQNKMIVANNLGTALVDYPTMALAGYAGFKTAGSPKLLDFKFSEPNPRNIREVTLDPGKLNLPKDFNIKNLSLKPALEYQSIKVSSSYTMFPVVPVDLKSNMELLRRQDADAQQFKGLHEFFKDDVRANRERNAVEADVDANNARKAAEAAVIGAAAALGKNIGEHAAPKLEQAPAPREILQIEPLKIQKLLEQIPQKPQAYIEEHRIDKK